MMLVLLTPCGSHDPTWSGLPAIPCPHPGHINGEDTELVDIFRRAFSDRFWMDMLDGTDHIPRARKSLWG